MYMYGHGPTRLQDIKYTCYQSEHIHKNRECVGSPVFGNCWNMYYTSNKMPLRFSTHYWKLHEFNYKHECEKKQKYSFDFANNKIWTNRKWQWKIFLGQVIISKEVNTINVLENSIFWYFVANITEMPWMI